VGGSTRIKGHSDDTLVSSTSGGSGSGSGGGIDPPLKTSPGPQGLTGRISWKEFLP